MAAPTNDVRAAVSFWRWGPVASGVVVALAIRLPLLWLGNAFSRGFGNAQPEGGFAAWALLVLLISTFLGAGVAAYVARASSMWRAGAVGVFTWALALVLGSSLVTEPLAPWHPAGAAWAAFVGALLSLAAAVAGGVVGGTRRRTYTAAIYETSSPPGSRPPRR
jgi:hypothetical protein